MRVETFNTGRSGYSGAVWIIAAGVFLLGSSLFGSGAAALETAGWRMNGNGEFPEATPPAEWSPTKNVIWSTPLANKSNGSPVLLNGMIFITAEPESLLCLDAATGKILWEKTNTLEDAATPEELEKSKKQREDGAAIEGDLKKAQGEFQSLRKQARDAPTDEELKKKVATAKEHITELQQKLEPFKTFLPPQAHPTNGYSSSTPVSDGKNVFAVFGNGVACCYDVKGNRVWIRHIENPLSPNNWGHSTSPLLSGDKLLVHLNDLKALNTTTGAEVWSAKVRASWGTPAAVAIGDTPAIFTPGGDLVRVSDGHVMAANVAHLEYDAPIVHDGVVYFIENGGKAVKIPEKAGDAVKPEVLWTTALNKERYYASPVILDGLIYAVTRYQHFSVIDAKTGALVYEKDLALGDKAECYPSIALAGKRIYVSADNGATLVLEPGREYKEVTRNMLEPFRGSPVFDGKRVYIRTQKVMYCIGEAP